MSIKKFLQFLPNKLYIQLYYILTIHKICNFKNPKTYNEKLQWLKLNDKNPLYPKIVDKYEVKKYIADKIGEEYVIPLLGVWDKFDDIDFNKLPDRFVLKCTHDCGSTVVVKNKNEMDKQKVKSKIEKYLYTDFYCIAREWAYKNVKPRIIAEAYMEDSKYKELRDYKFFCFDGVPKIMGIYMGRTNGKTKVSFFDMDKKFLGLYSGKILAAEKEIELPVNFEKMKELSRILSKDFKHVRVDFYEVDEKIYFGELTLYHNGGFAKFNPEKWDRILGEYINLDINKK